MQVLVYTSVIASQVGRASVGGPGRSLNDDREEAHLGRWRALEARWRQASPDALR